MDENGNTKDDVKVPEGEVGDRIRRMFHDEEKDCSEYHPSVLARWLLAR